MEIFIMILLALVAGLGGYAISKLTINAIKRLKKRRDTKMLAAKMSNFVRSIENNPNSHRVKLSDYDRYDSILAEYDPYTSDVKQVVLCNETEDKVDRDIRIGGGYVIYDE